jgi:hypothetical protein
MAPVRWLRFSEEMNLRNGGEPSGFAAITAPIMTLAMRWGNTADWDG